MTLKEIIQRAASGETLNEAECEELKNFQCDDDLRNELNSIIAERDQLQSNLTQLSNQNAISKIASAYQFTDSEYLAYKFNKNGIAPDSPEAGDFMESLKSEVPKLFKLDITPGIPTSTPVTTSSNVYGQSLADELAHMLANAPEIR